MRAWLFVLAVLATLNRVQQVASTEEVKSSSSSPSYTSSASSKSASSLDSNNVDLSDSIEKDNLRGNKPDPQTLVQIEKNLLSLFGFEKRPKVDRSKIVIPEAMKKLYAQIMGHELDSLEVPKADLHNKDANTIRSYTHEGELENYIFFSSKLYIKLPLIYYWVWNHLDNYIVEQFINRFTLVTNPLDILKKFNCRSLTFNKLKSSLRRNAYAMKISNEKNLKSITMYVFSASCYRLLRDFLSNIQIASTFSSLDSRPGTRSFKDVREIMCLLTE